LTLPPDATTATVLPSIAYLPLSTAAKATAAGLDDEFECRFHVRQDPQPA
jgi:hypothetical protein